MNRLEQRKAVNSVKLANDMLCLELECVCLAGFITVLEEERRVAHFQTFGELDSWLAGVSVGERHGEPKSCRSFSAAEWAAFQHGIKYGANLRKG